MQDLGIVRTVPLVPVQNQSWEPYLVYHSKISQRSRKDLINCPCVLVHDSQGTGEGCHSNKNPNELAAVVLRTTGQVKMLLNVWCRDIQVFFLFMTLLVMLFPLKDHTLSPLLLLFLPIFVKMSLPFAEVQGDQTVLGRQTPASQVLWVIRAPDPNSGDAGAVCAPAHHWS